MSNKVNLVKIKMEMNVADTDDSDQIPREMNTPTTIVTQDHIRDYDNELNFPLENNVKNEITIEEFDFAEATKQYKVKMENLNVILPSCMENDHDLINVDKKKNEYAAGLDIKDEFILTETTTTTIAENVMKKNLPTVRLANKSFECAYCGKVFGTKSTLTNHIKIHIVEKSLACNQCDKVFRVRQGLTKHMTIHTGEKRFACNQCDKVFRLKEILTNHIRIHTGEKPYACNQCDKVFRVRQGLAKHMRIHTIEQPFACNQCDKVFRVRHGLTKHMTIHTGEQPFECTQCDKRFHTKNSLTRHNQWFH